MSATHSNPSRLHDYAALTKPEVNLLVLMTTATGYCLACRGPLHTVGMINTLLGTLLVASGTATLNQWIERTWDAQMRRTANRPLPAGRISPGAAFRFGISMSIAGGLYLDIAVNRLAAVLALSTLLSYLLVYTPLKRKTPMCTLLGAIPGAMPALIGWSGASSVIDAPAWLLFSILFLWQFPHFLAIALMYREDYTRAGYKMLPEFDVDGCFTRWEIASFTGLLVAATLLMELRAGVIPALVVTLAGVLLLYPVSRLVKTPSRTMARRVVHASVSYLPIVLLVKVLCKG
ncbi:MAG TPA: heme o synthase [Terriglobales bacterium]|nr:heme o synthase [Terriglobales bacterium]